MRVGLPGKRDIGLPIACRGVGWLGVVAQIRHGVGIAAVAESSLRAANRASIAVVFGGDTAIPVRIQIGIGFGHDGAAAGAHHGGDLALAEVVPLRQTKGDRQRAGLGVDQRPTGAVGQAIGIADSVAAGEAVVGKKLVVTQVRQAGIEQRNRGLIAVGHIQVVRPGGEFGDIAPGVAVAPLEMQFAVEATDGQHAGDVVLRVGAAVQRVAGAAIQFVGGGIQTNFRREIKPGVAESAR